MSCVFVVVPVVVGGWPIVAAAFTGAASALGYQLIRTAADKRLEELSQEAALPQGVVLPLGGTGALVEGLERGETLRAERDGITAVFRRDGRGRCTVHVDGVGKSQLELQAAGRELVDRLTQQFAYARLMEQLEERGFDVVDEHVEADQTIRVRVRRWG